jgi:photosystem II stability/assembly factor-like uncharacterized protein
MVSDGSRLAQWERRGANGALPTIWSLTIDPVDPDILFAGTRPAAVYRSRDGGRQWEKLAVDVARECSIGIPFVTSVIVDPDDHRIVWAGVEIDGVFRSVDGGDTWTHLKTGLYDPDIHAVTIAPTQPKRLYASTAREVFTSTNLGDTWQPLEIREKWPLPYARGLVVKADDPSVLFAGCGETTTGEKGHVPHSFGEGRSWTPAPTRPCGACDASRRQRIVAFSLFGGGVRGRRRVWPRSRANSARSGPRPCRTICSGVLSPRYLSRCHTAARLLPRK